MDGLETTHSFLSSRGLHSIVKQECLSKRLQIYLYALPPDESHDALIEEIRADPAVWRVERNHALERRERLPNDPRFDEQWNLQKVGFGLAWEETTGGLTLDGDTIVVGVMETGLDVHHEDLSNLLWINRAEVPDNDFDDDHNGYIDDFYGVSEDHGKDDHAEDPEGHGTSVLSVIGAEGNNGLGISGANWNVKIALFSSKGQSLASAIKAYAYFLDLRIKYNESNGEQGAFIVATNSSYGSDGLFEKDNPIFCDMFNKMGAAGILSIGAAENDQGNADIFGDLPSNCSSDELIITTGTNREDQLSVGGFGRNTVDLGAPSENIWTAHIGNTYKVNGGTSYAAALVCGAAALLFSHPSQDFIDFVKSSPREAAKLIKDVLLDNVVELTSLKGKTVSGGRLDIGRAYESLSQKYPILQTRTDNHLSIYPQPLLAKTTLYFDAPVVDLTVRISDLSGRLIYMEEIDGIHTSHNVNTAFLPPGIYFLIAQAKGHIFGSKLIKY